MKSQQANILLWVALSISTGILAAFFLGINAFYLTIGFPVVAVVSYYYSRWRITVWGERVFTLTAAGSFVFMGAAFFLIRDTMPGNDISAFAGERYVIRGVALGNSRETKKGMRVIIKVSELAAEGSETSQAVSGTMMVYLPADAGAIQGYDKVEFTSSVKSLSGFMATRGGWAWRNDIHAGGYTNDICVTGRETGITANLFALRSKLEAQFRSKMPDERIATLSIAMLLGDRDGLDPEISKSYAASGASHLISVSGLHVVVMYEFMLVLLAMGFAKHIPIRYRLLFAIAILWAYCIFSGACPPVCRAVFMVTLVGVARILSLHVQSANLLGFSALVMLLWDPYLLFDIGFQLSFVAVLGLILAGTWFKEKSEAIFPKLPEFIHQISGASLAAQLFTLPLILLYFGQFPTYFMLTNIVIIPIADFAIKIGFGAIVLSYVPVINDFLFGAVDLFLWFITWVCDQIAGMPGAVIEKLSFQDTGFKILVTATGLVVIWIWATQVRRLNAARMARIK